MTTQAGKVPETPDRPAASLSTRLLADLLSIEPKALRQFARELGPIEGVVKYRGQLYWSPDAAISAKQWAEDRADDLDVSAWESRLCLQFTRDLDALEQAANLLQGRAEQARSHLSEIFESRPHVLYSLRHPELALVQPVAVDIFVENGAFHAVLRSVPLSADGPDRRAAIQNLRTVIAQRYLELSARPSRAADEWRTLQEVVRRQEIRPEEAGPKNRRPKPKQTKGGKKS